MQDVFDLLDIAAKNYPLKALAPEIGKADPTLRSELNQKDGFKLGLLTSFQILKITIVYRAFHRLAHMLGLVAFTLPEATPTDMPTLMQMTGDMTKEFGEHMQCLGRAMADGRLDKKEVKVCLKELTDVLDVTVKIKAYLEQLK